MSAQTQEAIREQGELIADIRNTCSLVDTVRGHKDIQESPELRSIGDVLMLAVNRLFELQQKQEAKLELMQSANDAVENQGGDQ